MTLPSNSIDLIVSSEVLEHVPDVASAFSETERVLRKGGCHIFTVPARSITKQKARLEGGRIVHFGEPEFHSDPLDPKGIPVYWDLGPDAPSVFGSVRLSLDVVEGPRGKSGRIIWRAHKVQ